MLNRTVSTSVYGMVYTKNLVMNSSGEYYRCDKDTLDALKIGSLYEFTIEGINIQRLGIYPKVAKCRFLHD